MDILTAKQIQSDELKKMRDYEEEMAKLSEIKSVFGSSYVSKRMNSLSELMQNSSATFDNFAKLEAQAKKKLKFE
jgi:hypothetical protein